MKRILSSYLKNSGQANITQIPSAKSSSRIATRRYISAQVDSCH
jgi:hypothetical protein